MPREGGKEVKQIPRLLCALVLMVTASYGQVLRQGDTEAIVAPLGIPCEPGDQIFGLFTCPPIEQQGVLVHVRSDDWRTGSHEEYAVTLTYRTAAGERRTATATAKRERDFGKEWDDGWRAVGFNVGRMATGPLLGISVESVAISKVAKPVVITVGASMFGEPNAPPAK